MGNLRDVSPQLRAAVLEVLAHFATAWPNTWREHEQAEATWCTALNGVPVEAIPPAIEMVLQRANRFPPPPGEFRADVLSTAARLGIPVPGEGARGRRWALFPESACPECGQPAEVHAERAAQGHLKFRVVYPPPCPCWAHHQRLETYSPHVPELVARAAEARLVEREQAAAQRPAVTA